MKGNNNGRLYKKYKKYRAPIAGGLVALIALDALLGFGLATSIFGLEDTPFHSKVINFGLVLIAILLVTAYRLNKVKDAYDNKPTLLERVFSRLKGLFVSSK